LPVDGTQLPSYVLALAAVAPRPELRATARDLDRVRPTVSGVSNAVYEAVIAQLRDQFGGTWSADPLVACELARRQRPATRDRREGRPLRLRQPRVDLLTQRPSRAADGHPKLLGELGSLRLFGW